MRVARRHPVRPIVLVPILVLACAGLETVGGLVPVGGTVVQLAANRPSFSDEDEERMARTNALTFEASTPMWDDPLLETYITQITQRLVAVANPRPFTYRIRVVPDASVNAFTFGGGMLYVHAGLIARMENEAQLAMVLGHEIAHVTERHIPRGIERAYGTQVLGQVGASTAASTGALQGEALSLTYEYSMAAAINGHGRGMESEADEVGLEYMVRAGYDPREAPRTFDVLLREYGDPAPLVNFFYGSHPTNVSRIERLTDIGARKYADRIGSGQLIVNTEEFARRTREVVIGVGRLDYEERRFNTARAMFEKAAPVSEFDPVPHYYLGRIAVETGGEADLGRAIVHLEDAIRIDPSFAPAHRELGLARYRRNDRPGAVSAFEAYLRAAPGADDAPRIRTMIAELRR